MPAVSFHPEAAEEVVGAAQYYEAREPGLGAAFLDEVDVAASKLRESPELFALRSEGTRHRPLRRFPHRLVYRLESVGIRVYAVAHPSRRPGYWVHRMEN